LQVLGVKAKLRAFLYGLGAIAVELALFYPASLIDQQVDRQIRHLFGAVPDWVNWAARGGFWLSIVFIPLAAFFTGQHLLEKRRRRTRFKSSLAEAACTAVRVAGSNRWTEFRADDVVALVVPDAIAAIGKKHGLPRLKAISWFQDTAISLAHVIGIEWRHGEARAQQGRQSFFRQFNPKYRTLSEHPYIRLEIATEGKEPIMEYFLIADPRDRKVLERFFVTLRNAVRRARIAKPVRTQELLDALPMQGSKYGHGWIETA
jgi:hypothetical protein